MEGKEGKGPTLGLGTIWPSAAAVHKRHAVSRVLVENHRDNSHARQRFPCLVLHQTLDFTSASEKSEIRLFCDKCFARLSGTDRELPQVSC